MKSVVTNVKLSKKELRRQRKLEKERALELEKQKNERDRLDRELKFSKRAMERGYQDWEGWCEELALNEIVEEVQVNKQGVERLKDRSEHEIQTVFEHTRHANEQYKRNLHSHIEIIDYLSGLYKMFIESLQKDFDTERDRMLKEFYDECITIEKKFTESFNNIKNTTDIMSIMCVANLKNARENFELQKSTIISSSKVYNEKFDENFDARYSKCFDDLQEILETFRASWSHKKCEEYLEKLKKVESESKNQKIDQEKIDELQNLGKKLNRQISKIEQDHLEKISVLKSEINYYINILKKLEENAKAVEVKDYQKLQKLSNVGHEKQQFLQKIFERLKLILKLSQICQNYEDQVEPYLEGFEIKITDNQTFNDENYMFEPTDNFNAKLSKAELDLKTLRSTRNLLVLENEQLQEQLIEKTYNEKIANNLKLLKIDPSPNTVCIPNQISNHIPQIVQMMKNRQRSKQICQNCLNKTHYTLP